jgi:hypothetical protein
LKSIPVQIGLFFAALVGLSLYGFLFGRIIAFAVLRQPIFWLSYSTLTMIVMCVAVICILIYSFLAEMTHHGYRLSLAYSFLAGDKGRAD